MRILHVIASMAPRDGGPSKACFEMARAVRRRGHEVSIFTTNKDGDGIFDVPTDHPIERDGVALRYFSVDTPQFWGTSWAMARALRQEIPRVDVVHLHSLYLFHDWVVGRECRRAGIPYVLRPHGTLDPYLYRRHRWRKSLIEVLYQNRVTRNAAILHFTTAEERTLASPYAFDVPAVVIPNGLDPQDYEAMPSRGKFRAKYPRIGDRPVILFLGRLNFKKGLDILFPAFATVLKRFPDAHLIVAGPDGGMEAQARTWVGQLQLTDRVHFAGMVLGNDKLELLTDADLFVLPSYSENFGIAVIEAMVCELPVVISDRVNLWREIEAAHAGWICPPKADAFARAIISALSEPTDTKSRGINARTAVLRQFQWTEIATALEKTYESIAVTNSMQYNTAQ